MRDGKLTHRRTVKSGGDFPASIAVSGRTVYVLNAGGTTNVTGFRLSRDGLRPLAGSTRKLGITNDAVPLFTDSPPQVGFSPDGRHLLYVQNTLAGTIEGFRVGLDGELTLVETENEGLPVFADGSGMEGLVAW
ncbi:hypothetical protein ACQP2Y_14520 [Actinoplanes sp. CA-051413]|uniref:hypothetical protein n=1 Tax=Actinoplanes sp. CA-051413 TaxID=3239899 RepID=UPI003D98BF92